MICRIDKLGMSHMLNRRPGQAMDRLAMIAPCRSQPQSPCPSGLDYTNQAGMDAELAIIHERLKAIPDHECRIRVLEANQAKFAGACLAVSALVGWGAGWLTIVLTHH
jgi:hypothetical protein